MKATLSSLWTTLPALALCVAACGEADESDSPETGTTPSASDTSTDSSISSATDSSGHTSGDTSGDSSTATQWWRPSPGQSWQIQYAGALDTSFGVDIYNIDLFDTSAETIAALHTQGRKVMCYFSAGSIEDWRPDIAAFPAEIIGLDLDGWPGEKWLDIRRLDLLRGPMGARLDLARDKGCDGVDPDNVNAYTNPSGFPLRAGDQLTFNRWLADEAHRRGLGIGLKNDLEQVGDLLVHFDWQLNEQCFAFDECDLLVPFIAAQKPVFHIEYKGESDQLQVCQHAAATGFSTIFKNMDLDVWLGTCAAPSPEVPSNQR